EVFSIALCYQFIAFSLLFRNISSILVSFTLTGLLALSLARFGLYLSLHALAAAPKASLLASLLTSLALSFAFVVASANFLRATLLAFFRRLRHLLVLAFTLAFLLALTLRTRSGQGNGAKGHQKDEDCCLHCCLFGLLGDALSYRSLNDGHCRRS
uniref:Uncharacterized protein n=1 Tax=Anopheles atroparvus TaxID=41427 RepID=A0AAG5CML6_ANOAO